MEDQLRKLRFGIAAASLCVVVTLGGCGNERSVVAGDSTLVERVGSTGFMQLDADSFNKIKPREQALAYWLSQASIALDPIIYDQLSRYGLREKRLLEALIAHPEGVKPDVMAKITAFTKLFWANKGNNNDTSAHK